MSRLARRRELFRQGCPGSITGHERGRERVESLWRCHGGSTTIGVSMDRTPTLSLPDDLTTSLRLLGDVETDEQTVELVYQELLRLARSAWRQTSAGGMQPTEVLHEAWMRLSSIDGNRWQDRQHFFRTASRIMRCVLVDFGRRQSALKRGGRVKTITLSMDSIEGRNDSRGDWLSLAEALDRLEAIAPRAARVAELRYLAGLQDSTVADLLDISDRTVRTDWAFARAWLRKELRP